MDVSTRARAYAQRALRCPSVPDERQAPHEGTATKGDPVRRVFARRSDYTKSVFCKVPEDARACERSKGADNRAPPRAIVQNP